MLIIQLSHVRTKHVNVCAKPVFLHPFPFYTVWSSFSVIYLIWCFTSEM